MTIRTRAIDTLGWEPDLAAAVDAESPVLIAYIAADGEESIRTIEPYEVATTQAGNRIVRAMDRRSREPRSFRLDRIALLRLAPGAFEIDRPPRRDGLTRARAEIAEVTPSGYRPDAARWTPDCPIYP